MRWEAKNLVAMAKIINAIYQFNAAVQPHYRRPLHRRAQNRIICVQWENIDWDNQPFWLSFQ